MNELHCSYFSIKFTALSHSCAHRCDHLDDPSEILSQRSYFENIKVRSSFAGWKKPSTIFNCSCKDITQHQKKVFSLLYCWLKCKKPVGNDEHCASNIAVHKINPLKPFYIFLDQEKNNEHKSNEIREPACFPKYTLDYCKHKRLRNRRTVQKNAFFHTHFKGFLCFLSPPPPCDYLFICLLICFSLPRVQRACVWCAPMAVFTKGEGRFLLHTGQREEKETCLLICSWILKASD